MNLCELAAVWSAVPGQPEIQWGLVLKTIVWGAGSSAPTRQLRRFCNSSSRGSNPLFWWLWALQALGYFNAVKHNKIKFYFIFQTNQIPQKSGNFFPFFFFLQTSSHSQDGLVLSMNVTQADLEPLSYFPHLWVLGLIARLEYLFCILKNNLNVLLWFFFFQIRFLCEALAFPELGLWSVLTRLALNSRDLSVSLPP